jgi:predicted ATP-dependent endonuclease of OLD family
MHLKEIILDGFKSYATRTVISGWDERFNAITGLNGSGKSNVLDSICFVLGITNLSQVFLPYLCSHRLRFFNWTSPSQRFVLATCKNWCTSKVKPG